MAVTSSPREQRLRPRLSAVTSARGSMAARPAAAAGGLARRRQTQCTWPPLAPRSPTCPPPPARPRLPARRAPSSAPFRPRARPLPGPPLRASPSLERSLAPRLSRSPFASLPAPPPPRTPVPALHLATNPSSLLSRDPLPLWIPPRRPHFSLVPSSLLFTLSLLSPYFSSTLPPSLFVPLLASSLSLSVAALDAMFLSSYPRAHCLPSSPLQRPEKTSTNIRPSLVTCPS